MTETVVFLCALGVRNSLSWIPGFLIHCPLAMKKSIAFLVLSCLTAPALADTLKFPADKPFASITFPEGWKAT